MSYKIFKHKVKIEDLEIQTYGIKVYEQKRLVRTLFDVSTDCNALSEFVSYLNKHRINSIHLDAMIEDYYLDNV